jgi:hypothetical protein
MLRIVVAIVAALSLLVGIAGEAGAEPYKKKHKRYAKKPVQDYSAARSYSPDAYVERDVNRLPFGSAIWWEQMQREGRLGESMQ